jgi:hypothetical protein
LESQCLIFGTKLIHLLLAQIADNAVSAATLAVNDVTRRVCDCSLQVASITCHIVVYSVDAALSLAAAVSDSVIYTAKSLTQRLLNICEALLNSQLIVSLSRHNRAGAKPARNIISGGNSAKFVTYHLVSASVSRPAIVAPTAEQKKQNPPAVVPAASPIAIIANALTDSHAFREFTHSEVLPFV